ncbi:hypothetical protein [Serratia proteamaculans]|uniref:Uncharacterized protein n=1 Tax=Serratia proteamaculans TaxID=28151 RepID=A0A5Q2VHJ1_SERPR|nr:hypothetical protein [Serratia proteamaculans]QGH63395.1 hypothetical protein GHV41_22240 [Serratia proteamaculans]
MSEFKGTPGNWVTSKSDRSIGPVSKDDDQSYGMIIPVAWVEFDDRPGHHQANANLIAAAPELLEALIQARVFVAGWHAKYDLEESGEALKACNYAINKALVVSDE